MGLQATFSWQVIFHWQYLKQYSHRHILEQKVTPIILDIEEETKDQHQVAQADEDDHHHAPVHRKPLYLKHGFKVEKSQLGITAICFFGTILYVETEFTALLMF
jgi:hypothetical protein